MLVYLDLTADGRQGGASWEMLGAWPGVSTMRSITDCHNVVNGSSLYAILLDDAPGKYCLSPRAASGILRRAEKKGKLLPPVLKEALEELING